MTRGFRRAEPPQGDSVTLGEWPRPPAPIDGAVEQEDEADER